MRKKKKSKKNYPLINNYWTWTLITGQLLMDVLAIGAWRYDTAYRARQWETISLAEDKPEEEEDLESRMTTTTA